MNNSRHVTRWRGLLKRHGGFAVPVIGLEMSAVWIKRHPWISATAALGTGALLVGRDTPTTTTVVSNVIVASTETETLASFSITDLGDLGGDAAIATGISRNGVVVGGSPNAKGETRAFVWQNGKMRDLGTAGGSQAMANGITPDGRAVGASLARGDENIVGFLQKDRSLEAIQLPGADFVTATGANSSGVAVGTALVGEEHFVAFGWKNGKSVQLPLPAGYTDSVGSAISENNMVVGSVFDESGEKLSAFVSDGNKTKALGGLFSIGTAVSDKGAAVGFGLLTEKDRFVSGMVWNAGKLTLLPPAKGFDFHLPLATSGDGKKIAGMIFKVPEDRRASLTDAFALISKARWLADEIRTLQTPNFDIRSRFAQLGSEEDEYPHASLNVNGKTVDLNTLVPKSDGWFLLAATGINDKGQIVGIGIRRNELRSFILNPK